MNITNKTKNAIISENAREARSFCSRLRGLMMTKTPRTLVLVSPHQSIQDSSIHMWFMRQAIDVIWLDEKFKVVDTYENARPWAFRIFRPKDEAKYVVECPTGTIKKTKSGEGDLFVFEN